MLISGSLDQPTPPILWDAFLSAFIIFFKKLIGRNILLVVVEKITNKEKSWKIFLDLFDLSEVSSFVNLLDVFG